MTGLFELWLPILLSSLVVFIASSIIHMLPLWHKNDYPKLPNEDKVLDALRPLGMAPGEYMMPRAMSTAEMRSREYAEKRMKGPVVMMKIWPNGPVSMSQNLIQWFIYCVVVGIFSGYITGRALPPGTDYLQVFRFAGATAFIGYTLALWQMSIWYGRPWSITVKWTFDGLIYSLLTAGMFGWLWPR